MNNSASPTLIGIGDLAADIVVRVESLPVQKNDFALADEFRIDAGGTSNFLIMAARLGVPSVAMGSLGDDAWGREVSAILETENVNLSLLNPSGSSTRALVLVDRSGAHAMLGRFGSGYPQDLTHEQQEKIVVAGAVFASGYSLSEQHLARLTLQAFHTAGEAGVLRAFDPGPFFARLPHSLQQEALRSTDLILLTAEELKAVNPEGLAALFDHGIQLVVLKYGENGCEVHRSDGKNVSHPGFSVNVVDTTGAGDSFDAGFLRAHAAGLPLETCALFANAVGAAKVQKLGGGQNVPTAEEIRKLLKQHGLESPLDLP